MKRLFLLFLLLVGLASLAACGGGGEEPPAQATVDPQGQIADSVQQTVAAIAVAQTVAAMTGSTPTGEAPGNLPTSAVSPTLAPPDATATTTVGDAPTATTVPVNDAPSCTVLSGVNLRSGPGTAYDPPVGSVGPNTTLRPLAYVAAGIPQGAWLNVEVVGVGQVAWVSAGPQFVRCTIDPASLPGPVTIPPTSRPPATNTPPPTATPQQVANLPPDLRNVSGGADCIDNTEIDSDFQTDSRFLLRVYAQLFDPPEGESGDGAGIDRVEFSVRDTPYTHPERIAGYCIFQGGEPTCRDWPRNSLGQLTWGPGGPVVVDGNYTIDVTVFPREETFVSQCSWVITLDIDVP
jgi:hypothetical protein